MTTILYITENQNLFFENLFHKQTRKVLNNYGKSIQTIAYFFSKICELITADGGDPASGYFEEQFKEVESGASSF